MAENAQQIATFPAPQATESQETAPRPIWKRQKGEPTLWWNRFLLYRNQGAKRSFVRAVAEEKKKAQALKSTKIAVEEAPAATQRRAKAGKNGQLQEVPKAPPVIVPGSWRAASVKWNWVARCNAYDENAIDESVESYYNDLIKDYANKAQRVYVLNQLVTSALKNYNSENSKMTWTDENAWIARIQSILRDIRDEMETLDEKLEKAILRKLSRDVYQEVTPERMEQARTEKAAGGTGRIYRP